MPNITFSDLCDISREFTHRKYEEQANALYQCIGDRANTTSYGSWRRGGKIYLNYSELDDLAMSLFQIKPAEHGCDDTEGNYERLVQAASEVLGPGFLYEIGLPHRYEADGCKKLATCLVYAAADASFAPPMRLAQRYLQLATEGPKYELLGSLPYDLAVYNEGIARCSEKAIAECSVEVEVDVSGWPQHPYRVTQTAREKWATEGRERYFAQPVFRERLRACSFRYDSIVLYDEEGVPIFRVSGLPTDSSDEECEKLEYHGEEVWNLTKKRGKRIISRGRQVKTIECLDLEFASSLLGLRVLVRRWDVHSGRFAWRDAGPSDRAPHSGQAISGYYCTDMLVEASEGAGDVSVQVTTSYDAWSVSVARYFKTLVYSPSITARIVNAEGNNGDFDDFRVQLYTSQSPFWRRHDGSRYLSDVSVDGNDDHNVSIRFSEQWLLPGEGYNITVEASKKAKAGQGNE